MPPWRPVNALIAGGGVHVGDRHDVVRDARVDQLLPASSTWSIAAMSAIEQPAARSGRITCCAVAGEDVGRLGHEVHAAEDDVLRVRPGGRLLGELEGVAGDVGELDHLVALVVVAEHEDPVAERGLGGAGPLDQVGVGGRRQVAGALDATLAGRVAARAQDQQRQGGVDGATGRQIRDCAHPSIVPHAPSRLFANLPVLHGSRPQNLPVLRRACPEPRVRPATMILHTGREHR